MPESHGEASDEMLMVRYQRGDRAAFSEIVRRYERPVYNFALRQMREATAAEDLAQETFLRVVQSAAEFKHEARFSTWLYAILRNLCVDHHRKRVHRRHPSLDQPVHGGSVQSLMDGVADRHPRAEVDRSVMSTEVAHSIIEALDALPDDQREVFLLREIANLPFRDIAKIVGVGENTIKSRMRYALERLQRALSDFEEYARALR